MFSAKSAIKLIFLGTIVSIYPSVSLSANILGKINSFKYVEPAYLDADIAFENAKANYLAAGLEDAVIDSGPNLAYRFDGFSLHAGLDALDGSIKTTPTSIGAGHSSDTDSTTENPWDSWNGEYHIGASYALTDRTQFGFHCRRSKDTNNDNKTYSLAVGGSYQYNDHWQIKLGTLIDKAPSGLIHQTNYLNHHQATIALGLQYWLMQNLAVDAGYSYVIHKKRINNNTVALHSLEEISGSQDYHAKINTFGFKFVWDLM